MADASVGTFSSARDSMEVWWRMLRALRGGTDAMREQGELYLPKDFAELRAPKRYAERLARTFLFNGYDDSVRKIAGRPFQRPVTVSELPPPLDLLETDADRCGTSLTVFASMIFEDMADRGFGVLLVDHTPADPTVTEADGTVRGMTLLDRDRLGLRPYFVRISPDNLLGCRATTENGEEQIVELRVRNLQWEAQSDYTETLVDTITVYKPDVVETWRHVKGTTSRDPNVIMHVQEQSAAGAVLTGVRAPMWPDGKISVVVVYANKMGPMFARPPLLNLAWLNVEHWQSSSEQRWKLHYERCNILKAKGLERESVEKMNNGEFTLGAGAILASTSENFDMSWVESAGTSLKSGVDDLVAIENRMRMMGLAPLTQTDGPATATGEVRAEVQQQAEAQKWVEALEWALYEAYKKAAQWAGVVMPEDFQLSIWRDFAISARAAQDLTALDSARNRKDLSQKTYLREIQKRGVIGDDVDIEQEVTDTEDERQASLPDMTALGMPDPNNPNAPPQPPQPPNPDPSKQAAA
jgi:hypothetical protein